jgi:hypothetical protein
MGTSGAYGGSGGRAWGKARTQAGDFADHPTSDNATQLMADIADALNWDIPADVPTDGAPADADQAQPHPFAEFRPVTAMRPVRGAGGAGAGGGAGGGGGGGGVRQRGTGGSGATSRQRSRARAAAVGGSVAAAGLAYRNRDNETLERFGLSLGQLDGLDSFEQARLILDAVTGAVGDVQEDELQHASGVAVLALLDPATTPEEAVRTFITDYVFEVSITEVGDELRDGTRDGHTTVAEEEQLRDIIETCVNQVELPGQLNTDNIQAVIYDALDDARTFLRASE